MRIDDYLTLLMLRPGSVFRSGSPAAGDVSYYLTGDRNASDRVIAYKISLNRQYIYLDRLVLFSNLSLVKRVCLHLSVDVNNFAFDPWSSKKNGYFIVDSESAQFILVLKPTIRYVLEESESQKFSDDDDRPEFFLGAEVYVDRDSTLGFVDISEPIVFSKRRKYFQAYLHEPPQLPSVSVDS